MKIIKEGKIPEEKIWRGTCHNCGTVAEEEQGKLKITHCQRDGSFASERCPFCSKLMNFYEKKEEVRRKI